MPRFPKPSLQISAVVVVALCAGCGPFGYLKKVAKDASRSVADAKAVGAEEYSPYEYWGSVAYLEQAKVLMGYSEYERSFDYGERSTQLANEAKVKAERVEAGESVVHAEGVVAPDEAPKEPVKAAPAGSPAKSGSPKGAAGGSL